MGGPRPRTRRLLAGSGAHTGAGSGLPARRVAGAVASGGGDGGGARTRGGCRALPPRRRGGVEPGARARDRGFPASRRRRDPSCRRPHRPARLRVAGRDRRAAACRRACSGRAGTGHGAGAPRGAGAGTRARTRARASFLRRSGARTCLPTAPPGAPRRAGVSGVFRGAGDTFRAPSCPAVPAPAVPRAPARFCWILRRERR